MNAIRNVEEPENTEKNIVKLQKQIDGYTCLGYCLLWVLDDASWNTNAYTAVKEAAAELAALRAELAAKDAALKVVGELLKRHNLYTRPLRRKENVIYQILANGVEIGELMDALKVSE